MRLRGLLNIFFVATLIVLTSSLGYAANAAGGVDSGVDSGTDSGARDGAGEGRVSGQPQPVQAMLSGPDVPFPFAVPAPFPWRKVEGDWTAHTPDQAAVRYRFTVGKNEFGSRVLHVVHMDPVFGGVLAIGDTVEAIGVKILNVSMQGLSGHPSYTLLFGSYKDASNPQTPAVLVATIKPLGEDQSRLSRSYMVRRTPKRPVRPR